MRNIPRGADSLVAALVVALVCCLAFWYTLFSDATPYASPAHALPRFPTPLLGGSTIPRVVVQTWTSSAEVPAYVVTQFDTLAPEFERRVFNDGQAADYVAAHYPAPVVEAYRRLEGAHRADLFRYCYLYLEGGVYLDIKTVLMQPLGCIVGELERAGCTLATCVSEPRVLFPHDSQVYQGVLLAAPGEAIFSECIEYIVRYWWRSKLEYFALIRNITVLLERRHGPLRPGITLDGTTRFYRERWSYFDCGGSGIMQRSKKTLNCSVITDEAGHVLFGTRFAEFPWLPT
jgi:hypothetical protein